MLKACYVYLDALLVLKSDVFVQCALGHACLGSASIISSHARSFIVYAHNADDVMGVRRRSRLLQDSKKQVVVTQSCQSLLTCQPLTARDRLANEWGCVFVHRLEGLPVLQKGKLLHCLSILCTFDCQEQHMQGI